MADIKLKINLDIKDHTYYCLDDIVTINNFGFIEIIFHQNCLKIFIVTSIESFMV